MVLEKPFPFGVPALPLRKQLLAIGLCRLANMRHDPRIVGLAASQPVRQSDSKLLRTFYEPICGI